MFWDPRILGFQAPDPSETRLRRLKMKSRSLKRKTKLPSLFEQVEITQVRQGFWALYDMFFFSKT